MGYTKKIRGGAQFMADAEYERNKLNDALIILKNRETDKNWGDKFLKLLGSDSTSNALLVSELIKQLNLLEANNKCYPSFRSPGTRKSTISNSPKIVSREGFSIEAVTEIENLKEANKRLKKMFTDHTRVVKTDQSMVKNLNNRLDK
jgi:hypothetical protein